MVTSGFSRRPSGPIVENWKLNYVLLGKVTASIYIFGAISSNAISKNLTISNRIHHNTRELAFKNGIALTSDDPETENAPADWKAEIERDTVIHPASGTTVRFLSDAYRRFPRTRDFAGVAVSYAHSDRTDLSCRAALQLNGMPVVSAW